MKRISPPRITHLSPPRRDWACLCPKARGGYVTSPFGLHVPPFFAQGPRRDSGLPLSAWEWKVPGRVALSPTENRFERKRSKRITCREGFYAPPAYHATTVNHRYIPVKGDERDISVRSWSWRGSQKGRKTPPYVISHQVQPGPINCAIPEMGVSLSLEQIFCRGERGRVGYVAPIGGQAQGTVPTRAGMELPSADRRKALSLRGRGCVIHK